MAEYCFRAKMVQFSKGQSAVHTAAYNSRSKLEHRAEDRQTRNYAEHGGLIFTGIFAPKDAPDWVKDRNELWNRAEEAERQQANGQPARNIMLALPHELSEEARLRLVKDFVREAFVRKGMVADVNIHAPDIKRGDDPRNFHAHILLTTRTLDGENFAKTKTDARHWNKGSTLAGWKEKWAHMGAKALEKEGSTLEAGRYREGHRRDEAQAEAALARGDKEWFDYKHDKTASLHNGPAVTEMERKGVRTDRGDENRAIAQLNENVRELRAVEAERVALQGGLEKSGKAEILGKVAGEIRLAKSLSNSVDGFVENLAMRDMTLAVVSAEEALASERKAAFAQEVGNRSTRLKAGEVVAVNKWGSTYRLTGRTLGETTEGAKKFLAGIDKAALLDVTTSAEGNRPVVAAVDNQAALSRAFG